MCASAVDRLLVPHGVESARGDHHGLRLAADLLCDMTAEVIDDDLRSLGQVVRVQRDRLGDLRRRLGPVDLGVVLAGVGHAPEDPERRVVPEHVEDEALLDGLAH